MSQIDTDFLHLSVLCQEKRLRRFNKSGCMLTHVDMCGRTGTEIRGFCLSDMDEKHWWGSFWGYHGQYDLSEAGVKENSAKADSLAVPYLQVIFSGKRWCLCQANVKLLKIFQGKLNTLNSILSVRWATREDRRMQVCKEHEFMDYVV